MSFLKKLKEADDEVKSSIVNITPNNKNEIIKNSKRSDYKDDKESISNIIVPEVLPFQGKQLWKDEINEENDDCNIKNKDSILWKVSEYLFDLFDANCLDGYKKIEEFEDRILKHFIDDNDEYTFEQERCHREFLDLFESLIEKFLTENKCTTQLFFAEVNLVMQKKSAHHNKEANEIVDIIFCYCDFRSWIDYMKEQAKKRFTLMEQLSMNRAAAKTHRFESEVNK